MRSRRDPVIEERPQPKRLNTEKPAERPTVRSTERPAERPDKAPLRLQLSKEKDLGRLRNTGSESRPLVKFKEASQVARDTSKDNTKDIEVKKPTSILDRIVKPSDQLKRSLPQSKEQARTEEAYDRVIKKVKPDTTSE